MRRVLRNFPGEASTIPRSSAVCSIPARFTAVRCPGVARSTAFPPDCTPRTRSRSPLGKSSTSSPGPTLPEISVPVTTDPNPFMANARSIGSRKYRAASFADALAAASLNAFFNSPSPAPVFALTGTSGAFSRNDPRRNSSASIRTSSSVSLSTMSLFVSATTPRFTPSNRQISKCSRVCGLMDSSAAITRSSTSMPAAPASMLLTNLSCPGTSTKPKRTPFSSRNAKPKSIVIPRRFSSARRSGCVPVSASTSVDLPWSMCPAVPTITLFIRMDMVGSGEILLPSKLRIVGKLRKLFRGGNFFDDSLCCRPRIGRRKNGPANHEEIGAGAKRFGRRGFPGLVFGFGFRRRIFRANAGRHNQEITAASFADRLGFLDRSDHAIDTGFFCNLRQFHDTEFGTASDPHFLHGLLIHARQDGDRQEARPVGAHRNAGTDGLRRGFEHGRAAERVHVDELHPGHRRRGKHGAGNGVGYVVEFQVEKNAGAQGSNFLYRRRTRGRKELVANLEHAHKIGNLLCELRRTRKRIEIQCDDQAAAGMRVESQGHS